MIYTKTEHIQWLHGVRAYKCKQEYLKVERRSLQFSPHWKLTVGAAQPISKYFINFTLRLDIMIFVILVSHIHFIRSFRRTAAWKVVHIRTEKPPRLENKQTRTTRIGEKKAIIMKFLQRTLAIHNNQISAARTN